jgi:hypothetical protein
MSSFRNAFDVLREAAGSYVNGIFTSGARSVIKIQASIQPVTGQDMITAPEGRRIQDMIKAYTDSDLQEGEEGLMPDMIVWNGYAYEINSIDVRQMGVIDHYKVNATRRMKAPTGYAASWVAGTLTRG